MAKSKLTFNDLRDGLAASRSYGLTTRETEQQLRNHLSGASQKEMKQVYKEFYQTGEARHDKSK